MSICTGKWRARGGLVATVYEHHEGLSHPFTGRLDGKLVAWDSHGEVQGKPKPWDLHGRPGRPYRDPRDLMEYVGPLEEECLGEPQSLGDIVKNLSPVDLPDLRSGLFCAAETESHPYHSLAKALKDAYNQAAIGKGKERHADNQRFDEQPMFHHIANHGVGFATGQADKKATEAHGLPHDAARKELLGAIVYLAAAYIAWPEDGHNNREE